MIYIGYGLLTPIVVYYVSPLFVIMFYYRVFLKTLKAKYALEDCRNSSVDFVALQIQRVMR